MKTVIGGNMSTHSAVLGSTPLGGQLIQPQKGTVRCQQPLVICQANELPARIQYGAFGETQKDGVQRWINQEDNEYAQRRPYK